MTAKLITAFLFLLMLVSFTSAAEPMIGNLIAGKQVEKEAKLTVGTKLVAVYEKKNYLVDILDIHRNGTLKILWIESKEESDEVAPNELYYIGESAPTRKSRSAALPEAYRSYDKNGDGQIGLYEWNRANYAEFRKLDKNRDGFLTPQELAGKGTAATTTTAAASTTTATPTPAATTPPAAETPATTPPAGTPPATAPVTTPEKPAG